MPSIVQRSLLDSAVLDQRMLLLVKEVQRKSKSSGLMPLTDSAYLNRSALCRGPGGTVPRHTCVRVSRVNFERALRFITRDYDSL